MAKTMTTAEMELLAARYVGMWNEVDPVRRRAIIASLFSDNVAHFTKSKAAHGHAGMEQRVIGSHDNWVRDGGCEFRVTASRTATTTWCASAGRWCRPGAAHRSRWGRMW